MADIIITEFMDEAAVASLAEDYDVLYDPGLVDRMPDLLAALAGARAIIVRNRTQVNDRLLDAGRHLVVVGRLGVGLDNIDGGACDERGVAVKPALGANAAAVAEYVITALLVLRRGVFGATGDVIAGSWPRTALVGGEVAGMRLGLVGYGDIARQVASRAFALGMIVAAFDPYLPEDDPAWVGVESLDLEDLVVASDALSLHVPLNEGTKHLVDEHLIGLLPDTAIVVNTSRGGVVDEAALVAALREGRLGGAALDVFESEPIDTEGGSLFEGVPNLVLTPHVAGITRESNTRVSAMTADQVRAALEGRV